jgi:hypothetical protein
MGLHGLLGDSFNFLYVDNVRTSQEAHLWTTAACYGDCFTFFICTCCSYLAGSTPMDHCSLLRGLLYFLYMQMMFVPRRKHTYGPLQPVTGIALLSLYAHNVPTSQETHLWISTACYGDTFSCLCIDNVRTSQEAHVWTTTTCYGDCFTFFICR